jgi:uncharacterized protein
MPAEDNLAAIKGIDEAFGKGDVGTILNAVGDDVDWAVDAEPVAPWCGAGSGKEGVASFFAEIASSTEVQDFAVTSLSRAWAPARTRTLLSCLRRSYEGHRSEASFHRHHYFRFGDDGKIE